MKSFLWGVPLLLVLVLAAACGGEASFGGEDSFSGQGAPSDASQDSEPTQVPLAAPTQVPPAREDAEPSDASNVKVQASLLPQNRIIVHTATLSLVIEDVARAVDGVTRVADRFGGWVVSSERQSRHSGAISIRVPAQSLDAAIREIQALALETEANQIASQDVTEEFVDSQSRLESLRATEQRLLSFLDQAVDVEEALKVESELGALQLRIEEIQGRLNYLSEVAAYSLINVNLRLTPVVLDVDPGADAAYRVGQTARFQATFVAPQDVDDFSFEWDFGDGTTARGRGSAQRPDGRRVTASVSHAYGSEGDYVASVTLTGTGDGGIAEGANSLLVSVSEVPTIEVFAGDNRTVEEGAELEYAASFTRPVELRDYEYRWDFGDGSPTVTGSLEVAGTRLAVVRAFANHRPTPFTVQVTVSAVSEAGRVSGSDSFTVLVVEAERFVSSGWEISGTLKSAVRALTALAQILLIVLIWVGVFSPFLLIGAGIVYLVNRRQRRMMAALPARRYIPPAEPSTEGPGDSAPVQPDAEEPGAAPAGPDAGERR